jgi:hypothetical protein
MNGILDRTLKASEAHDWAFVAVNVSYTVVDAETWMDIVVCEGFKERNVVLVIVLGPLDSPDEIEVSIALTLGHDEARSGRERP